MDKIKRVIDVALAEVGYKEKKSNAQLDDKTANAGDKNYTKYARDFDTKYPKWYNGKKQSVAWCDMFVDWCFLTAFGYAEALALLCQPEKSAGAGCSSSYRYYKKKGQVGKVAKVGAQIFFGSGESALTHTGLVYQVDEKKVYTIEGNAGNAVSKKSYTLTSSKIYGYGYPAYGEEAPVATPTPTPVVQNRPKTVSVGPRIVWDYLLDKLGNPYGVAGLMGNLYAESALKPINLESAAEKRLGYTDDTYTDAVDSGSYKDFSSDSAGYGLAQWTYKTRKAALLEYAQSVKSSIGNATTQLEYLWIEIQGFKKVLEILKTSTSIQEASDIVLTDFEKPANQSDAVKAKRSGYAEKYYQEYAAPTPAPGPAPDPTPTPTPIGYKIEGAKSKEAGYGHGKKFKTTARLNFRAGAGYDKYRIKVLEAGDTVTWYGYYTIEKGLKWLYVKDGSGATGFVSSEFVV